MQGLNRETLTVREQLDFSRREKTPFAARNHTINAEALKNPLKCRRSGHDIFSSTTRHWVFNKLRLWTLAYLTSPHRYTSNMLLL